MNDHLVEVVDVEIAEVVDVTNNKKYPIGYFLLFAHFI